MTTRLCALAAILLASSGYVAYAMQPESVPIREPLARLASPLGHWTASGELPLTEDVLDVLGVDDYVSRAYRQPTGEWVSLYVGYYESQREGDTIHSPMNCLPGAGWLPVSTSPATISVPTRTDPITVKRVVIQKGLDQQVVYYWYQSHGRVIGNEYWSKVLMVYDAFRLNRSDAALVRVVSPIIPGAGGEQAADSRATDFIQALFGSIERHLPG